MAETLNLLTFILGAVQVVDILIALGLYFVYNKNTDYLYVLLLWVGMCLTFMTDSYLGSFSAKHVFFSSIFAGFSGVALTQLVSRHYKVESSLLKHLKYLFFGYLTSVISFSLGIRNLTFLAFIICLSYLVPLFLTLFAAYKNIKKMKFKKITMMDYVFLLTVLIWGIHYLDYPFLRPLENLKFSVFGFSFALLLTYLTSIILPVVINRRIYLYLNDTLEEKLQVKSAQLKKAQEHMIAKEKLASLGALSAGIAHEIKNPLNIIKSSTYVIRKFYTNELPIFQDLAKQNNCQELTEKIDSSTKRLKTVSELIDTNVNRADNIIQSMLAQSRGSKSQLVLSDMNNLIKENINFVIDSTWRKYAINIKVNYDFKANEKVNLYYEDFGRMVINIVDNALYAMAKKDYRLGEAPLLEVSTYEDGDFFYLSIKDNGTGIPEDLKHEILNPFYTTKPVGEGTGLGLSIVYDVVKLHEGTLEIESKESQYTLFKMSFYKKMKNM